MFQNLYASISPRYESRPMGTYCGGCHVAAHHLFGQVVGATLVVTHLPLSVYSV